MATVEHPLSPVGTESGSVRDVKVYCPADGRLVGTVPDMEPSEVAEIAARLRQAQPAWEALGPDGRARHLLSWLDWIFDNEDRLLELVQAESGKSSGDTKIETMVASEVINFYAKNAARFLAPETRKPHNVAGATK